MRRKYLSVILLLVIALMLPSCMPAQDRPVSGQTEPVNGMVKNLSPMGLKIFTYNSGKFTLLEEKQSDFIYSDGGTVRNISLRYYTSDSGGVIISSVTHAANITDLKDIDLREALPVSDTFEVMYTVAADASSVLLAVNANGVIDTLLADLNTSLVQPLLPSDKLTAPNAQDGLCVTRCAPLQLSEDGNKLLFLTGPTGGNYTLMYYDFTAGEAFPLRGAAISESKVFSGCDIRWLDNSSAVVSYPDSNGTLEIFSVSKEDEGEAVSAMAVSSPKISYSGSYANGWSFEQVSGSLTMTRLSDDYKVEADIDLSEQDFSSEKVVFSPSKLKTALYSDGTIYIVSLTDGSVSEIDAEEKYQSMYETARPLYWLDDETLLFNSGTTDNGGQLSVTPLLIKVK